MKKRLARNLNKILAVFAKLIHSFYCNLNNVAYQSKANHPRTDTETRFSISATTAATLCPPLGLPLCVRMSATLGPPRRGSCEWL